MCSGMLIFNKLKELPDLFKISCLNCSVAEVPIGHLFCSNKCKDEFNEKQGKMRDKLKS